MSIFAHNLYRLFANELGRYSKMSDEKIFEKFISNSGKIEIKKDEIKIELKKKRDLPQILEIMKNYDEYEYNWMDNKKIKFYGASTS